MNKELKQQIESIRQLEDLGLPVSKEQLLQLKAAESTYIEDELLCQVQKAINPFVSELSTPFSIVINYTPKDGIVVRTSDSKIAAKSFPQKSKFPDELFPGMRVDKHKSNTKAQTNSPSTKRAPNTGLCVWISENEFVQEETAILTMIRVIELAGVESVAALKIRQDDDFLVSKAKHPKYSSTQKPLKDGYLLNTHSGTQKKKRQLTTISNALHLGWRIEIVK